MSMLDNQLRLHAENLALFLEPTLRRTSIGFYSVSEDRQYHANDSEKASLVALKEISKTAQGVTEYEVPHHIEHRNLVKGCEVYSDDHDLPDQSHLLMWLKKHPTSCQDVDVVCTHQVVTKIFKAPYTEPSALPWEVKVVRGPDGICYLTENQGSRLRYSEMNLRGKQQIFRQRAFKRYMTIKKGDHSRANPPEDHGASFYRVNKVQLDSGTIVYQSEVQCFDINYNAIDLKVQLENQYELPGPTIRLNWWSSSYLAGSSSVLSGYCDDVGGDDYDDNTLTRLLSFDLQQIKPNAVRDMRFDEEICIASLCTFIQFVKDLTANGKVASCVIRFEPGSKRLCVLDLVSRRPSLTSIPGFSTQISATDETSSVEATPSNSPRKEFASQLGSDAVIQTKNVNPLSESIPRLRQVSVNEAQVRQTWPRRPSMIAETDSEKTTPDGEDEDDKYKPKSRRRGKMDEEDDLNWFHVGIILMFMAIALIIVPILIERYHIGR